MEPKSVIRNKKALGVRGLLAFTALFMSMFLAFQTTDISRDQEHFVWSWQAITGIVLVLTFFFILGNMLKLNSGLDKTYQDFRSIFRIEPDDDRVLAQKYVNATLEKLRQKAQIVSFELNNGVRCRGQLDRGTEELDLAKKNFWDAAYVADDHRFLVPDNIEEPVQQLNVYG